MVNLILKDNTEYELEDGSFLGFATIYFNSYSDFAAFAEKMTEDNLSSIRINEQPYKNISLQEPHFKATNVNGQVKVKFALREMTESEIKADAAMSAAAMLTDEQAITVKELYNNYAYGVDYKAGDRATYNGYLYKALQDHTSQEGWEPGAAPSLWVALEVVPEEGEESPAGTLDDPIPVPDTVTTSGMEYEYGKYYIENGVTYLCKRGGVEDPESMYGQKETLYFAPSALIGQYFEVA